MATSQNGYPVITSNRTTGDFPRLRKTVIPGANRHFYFRDGSVAMVLAHFLLWFHEKVERIDLGVWDEWGWANRLIRGGVATSNHASGTAFDVNATVHPLGKRYTFKAWQYARMRARLVFYRGCIRLGLDYKTRPDEMHGEIVKPLLVVQKLARYLCSTPRGKRILAANPGLLEVIWDGKPPATTVTTEFDVFAMAQRYDRTPEELLAYLRTAARDAEVMLLTEMTGRERRAVLSQVKGFTVHQDVKHGDLSEIAILTRDVACTATYKAHVIGPDLGPGGRVILGLARATFGDGTRELVGQMHLPASVEADWDGDRAIAFRAAVQEARRIVKAAEAEFKPHGVDVFADWNLNLHKPWVQEWVTDAWPELKLPPAAVIPKGSTHAGGRLIDWFIFRGGLVVRWVILAADPASDHRGNRVTRRITRKA